MPNDVDLTSIVMALASRVTSLEAEMETLSASVTLVREAAFAAGQSIETSLSLLQETVAGLHDDMAAFGEAITQLQAKSHDLDAVAPGLRSWISELQLLKEGLTKYDHALPNRLENLRENPSER